MTINWQRFTVAIVVVLLTGCSREPDLILPVIVSTTPEHNGINVAPTRQLVVEFSESMTAASLVWIATPRIEATVSWSDDSTEVSLTPTGGLAPSTRYSVVVDGQDLSGNRLTGFTRFGFTTVGFMEAAGGGAGSNGGGTGGTAGGSGSGGGAGTGVGGGSGVTGTPYVYVGSGNGVISIYTLDLATGALADAGAITAGGNPTFLAVDPQRRNLFAVNESGANTLSAFKINPSNGLLTFVNTRPSGGNGPTHLSVDQTGRWVFVANNTSGSVGVFPIGVDGGLDPATDTDNSGAGAQQILADPSNRFVLVPTPGTSRVVQYLFDADAGTLTNNAVPFMSTDAGAGPRHLAFHPGAKRAYLINQQANTIQALGFNDATGQLTSMQQLSTLPVGAGGFNFAAEVFVHPSGRFVYGSNRGNNSIVGFSIDPTTGLLTLISHTPTGGNTPRSFAIDPSGTVLLVANQASGTVTSFRIDVDGGTLTALGQSKAVNNPGYVGVVSLP